MRYQTPQFYDALSEIAETANDTKARSEAETLCNALLKFTVALVFWYAILFQVNLISKQLQAETVRISDVVRIMEKLCILGLASIEQMVLIVL